MRSYGQYCALARALDVVGDRWTLLVVRELLLRPRRYGELQDGLPGIATNLLAERLRHLESSGVVTRDGEGRYALSEWGRGLAASVRELVRWGAVLMNDMDDTDAFRPEWLEIPFDVMFGGSDPERPDATVEIRTGDEALTLRSEGGRVVVRPGPATAPDVMISGQPDAVVGLLAGRLDADAAARLGVSILGDVGTVARLRRPDWLHAPA